MTAKTAAPNATAQPSEANHVPVLDGIRGLAILLVMTSHFYGLTFGLAGIKPTWAIDRFIVKIAASGWMGVDLFFVLSGFLITGILFDAKESAGYFRNFYARRVLRIFPLYYGFLVLMLFVVPHIDELASPVQIDKLRGGQFFYWTYLVNVWFALKPFHNDGSIIYVHFWSLAVEEQFYVVWPLVVLAFARRQLMYVCGGIVVAAFALRVVLTNDVSDGLFYVNAPHVLMPARMDTLALGALLALAARTPGELERFARWGGAAMAGAAVIVVALFVKGSGLSTLDANVDTIGFSALAILFAALLAMTVTSPPGGILRVTFSNPILRFFGRYAYALYVFHVIIAFELAQRFATHGWIRSAYGMQLPMNVIFMAAGMALSVLVAYASWHLYEKQFLKLKRFVPYGRGRGYALRSDGAQVAAPAGDAATILSP